MKITPLDKKTSEYVRKRAIIRVGGCEKCGAKKYDIQKENGDIYPAWKQLENSHYYRREIKATRYDPTNCTGLCFGCHKYLGNEPEEHKRWFTEHIGQEEKDKLDARIRHNGKVDEEAWWLFYKQELKNIDKEYEECQIIIRESA